MPDLVELVHPWINTARAPLYTVVFPATTTDADVVSFASAREEWATRARYPVAWVVDLSNITNATPTQRRLFSEHLERFESHDIAYNQGSALVVPNAVLRGIVTAVFWMKRPRFPNECFATLAEATHWATAQLKKAPPPPSSRTAGPSGSSGSSRQTGRRV
jgi:hypothetical protein